MPNAYMTKMAKAKKQNLDSFTHTSADGIERTYKRTVLKSGLVTYKCVGENCKPKRKKSKKQQRKKLATAAAKAARTRSKRMSKRDRRARRKSKDCGIGERYVRGKGCVLRQQSQFAGKFMTGFGGGKRKSKCKDYKIRKPAGTRCRPGPRTPCRNPYKKRSQTANKHGKYVCKDRKRRANLSGLAALGFGGGKRKIRVGPRGGRYVLKGGKKVYL